MVCSFHEIKVNDHSLTMTISFINIHVHVWVGVIIIIMFTVAVNPFNSYNIIIGQIVKS